ncbi:SH3 domain-containing protein [Candidatus Pelagibacter sp.]|jgi:SH3-like domain-containing protein|nr:SH3 domain-containing protein [Candidatus Pelagibacter sp.]
MKKKIIILFFFLSILNIQFLNADEKFLSLKKSKVNVRYGPSFESKIKFIYKKKNLPIKQIDKKENWRRIVDLKNNSGWIHWSQLKPSNSIIILENKILYKKNSNFSEPIARLEKGRLLIIKKCLNNWCKIKTENYTGWIKNENIWGSTK